MTAGNWRCSASNYTSRTKHQVGAGHVHQGEETEEMDPIYWALVVNKNTDRGDNFLGTADNIPLIIHTNNTEVRKAIEGGT
jgi:hypothetical protein